jgi:hypothetical protein
MIIVDAMNHINTNRLEIDKNMTKPHEKTSKHLKYVKERNKKVHKMNKNMVSVLSNLSFAMCHAFIKVQLQMPPPIIMSESMFDYLASLNN